LTLRLSLESYRTWSVAVGQLLGDRLSGGLECYCRTTDGT
jgi:hypothetical protein